MINQGRHPVDFFAATKLNFYVILNHPSPPNPQGSQWSHDHLTSLFLGFFFKLSITQSIQPQRTKILVLYDLAKEASLVQLKCSKVVCTRGTSILEEVRNVEISGPYQQLLCSKYHDFLAIFALAHSKINQIAYFLNEIIQEVPVQTCGFLRISITSF